MDFRRQLSAELPVLRRFARALTGDPALADDLVQDCLERAMLKSHLYDSSRPLRAWLFTMLRNLHISGMRRNSRATVIKTVDDLMDSEGSVPPEQENRLAAGSVSEALSRLSPQHREVIVLVGLEEMSYRDVSEILGVPVGTIMSRLSRAREQMRQLLEDRGHIGLRRVK
jgi:RNA polymerase sigma-70 factor (ECF subfamily)